MHPPAFIVQEGASEFAACRKLSLVVVYTKLRRHLVAKAAPGLIKLEVAGHKASRVVRGGTGLHEALSERSIGLATYSTDSGQFCDGISHGQSLGHDLKGLAPKVGVESSHDDQGLTRQLIENGGLFFREEMRLIDGDDTLARRLGVKRDAGKCINHGGRETKASPRLHINAFFLHRAHMSVRFYFDAGVLPQRQNTNELLRLARIHAAGNDMQADVPLRSYCCKSLWAK